MPPTQPSPPAPLDKLKGQLQQLDALLAEGTLTGDAAKSARHALEQQIVAAVLAGPAAGAPVKGAAAPALPEAAAEVQARPSGRLVAGVVAFVLVFSAAGYAWRGQREGLSVGPGDSGADQAQAAQLAQIDTLLARLVEHLKAEPDDAKGWAMLARSYTAQGKFAEALPAFKRVVALRPNDAQALADYADGLAVANNRTLEGEPEKLIAQALKLDPKNVKALSLAGTIAFNRNDFAAAVAHWDNAVRAADPASDFAQQLQSALNEARQRAGLPPAPPVVAAATDPAAAPAPAPMAAAEATPPTPAAATGPAEVSGRISRAAAAKADAGPDAAVFIFARAPSGSRMPLAILRKKVSDLPLDFKLDDSLAMSPAAKLSSVQQVVVGARISKSGNAMPQPGDWQVISSPVAVGAKGLKLEIAEKVEAQARGWSPPR
jgi:cytochrome c-type biogenesis protein CcmH